MGSVTSVPECKAQLAKRLPPGSFRRRAQLQSAVWSEWFLDAADHFQVSRRLALNEQAIRIRERDPSI